MKKLITYLKTLWRRGLDSQRKEVGVISGEATIEHPFSTYSAPFGTCWQPSGKLHSVVRCAAMLVMLFTLGSGNAWGTEKSFTFTPTSKTAGTTSGDVPSGVSCTYNNSYAKNQCTKNNSFSFSTSGMSSITINRVVVSLSRSKSGAGTTTIKIGNNTLGTRTSYNQNTSSGTEYTFTNSSNYTGEVSVGASATGSSLYFWYVTIYYEESTPSCSTDPSVGASSNSSINVTGGTVSCTGITKGDCDIDEWGFVYGTATEPTGNAQKVSSGKSTTNVPSFNKTLTGLDPNQKYYVRAYAKVGSSTFYGSETNFTTKTITASSSNTTYGTVSRSKMVITGSPKSGGQYASPAYTVTGSTPADATTVTQSGNTFTVTSTSTTNITVTINFEAIPTYTVTWVAGSNSSFNSQTGTAGTALTDPGTPSAASYCPGGKVFVGWTATPIVGEGSAPADLFTSVSGKSIPVGGTTYYAVFATQSDFTRVTSTSQLAAGKLIVVVDDYNSKVLTTTPGYDTAPTESSSKITPSSNMIWTLEANSTNWKLKTGSSYLGVANTSNGTAVSLTSTNSVWTIAASSSGTNNFYLKNTSGTNYCLEYNSSSSVWCGYGNKNYATSTYFTERLYVATRTNYATTCCTDPGLNYGTASVTKTYGASAFTNPLTNSHSVGVTYDSSDKTVATVDSEGEVTILKAGTTTITASSIAQTVSTVDYCADEASYTLTVNKASISPTLSYDPAAVTVGSTLTSFTLSGNSGSGSVSYSSSNDAIATVNSSGVVTGVAPGTVTITATIAATTNYNGNTATSNTITVNAAACTGVNSLHTGNKDQGGWVTNQCFEDADWGAADDAIYVGAFPLTNECYVGWAGGGSYYGTNWAVGGIKTYDIPTGRTLGWNSGNYYESYPGGALGTFHIYKNSTDENYYLRFKPSSYILRTGSDGTSWTSREMTVSATNSHYYETAELDLTSTLISEHAYVDLKTSSGHVWCNFSNDRTASGNVKVKSSVGDADGNFRGDNLKASDNGTHGKFRIDITKDVDNWKLAFVPMYRITYAAGTGASGSMDPSSYAEISTTIAAAANGFTAPTGKQFNGWSDGVNSYAAGANVTMNSNVTLTAQWTDIDYTVTVSQSPDVSATTTGQTSTAHYNGTINLTVTDIPSGYRFVNWTTSDGFSITNSTSATTASFTMPAKNVTVTANFQQTHTVDWYVGGSAVGNKLSDDGQTLVVDDGGKISAFPATTPDGSPCDKVFVGWTNTSSYTHGTSPLFNDVAGSPTINADANFYAVFATGGSSSYNLVESDLGTAWAGDYLIAYSSTVFADGRLNGTGSSAAGYGIGYNGNSVDPDDNLSANGKVVDATWGDTYNVTLEEIMDGDDPTNTYVLKTKDNYYNYITSNTNGIAYTQTKSTAANYPISITFNSASDIELRPGGAATGTVFSYNTADYGYFRFYKNGGQQDVYLYKKTGGYSDYTINCASCSNEVTVAYDADPTGGTVAVTKGGNTVAENGTVKTCTGNVDLTVTITPASHYTLTKFRAKIGSTTLAISPDTTETLPKTVATTFTVTIPQNQTGTLNITPVFEEDAHKIITWVVHGSSASIADGHGTTWVYSGENLTGIPSDPSAPAGCVDKEFVGWSEYDGGATEGDASDYTDLFTTLGGAPTGITTNRTFYAVFATPAAGMGGTVMWDEPWTGATAGTQPSGTTGYNSTAITYSYSESGCKIYDEVLAGGTSPELLVKESGGNFTASNIPAAGQTSLTLTYKSNKSLTVSTNTTGVTVGDADVDGSTYTRTITIDQSGLGVANFDLVFTKTAKSNARLDDIHVVVPGSSSMSGYVTTCEDTWTVTYYKNTEDAVTNLPSPTGISKSTGSGTLSSKVPVRYGYTFDGWAISAGGSVVYAAGAAVSSVSADMDLYAKWSVTPVTEINLSKTSLDKYVGDPSVTLSVLSVLPDGANTSVTWSSSNSSIASVNSSTGEVNFVAEGTANIIATSSITSGTTATCVVTVWAKPTVSFLDNLHSLTEDKDGNALSGYNLTDVAGTPVVFPILANQSAGSGTCEDEHYVFVGWTTSDNNTDPEDHLVTSHNLTNGDNITYYAVWADGVAGTTYTKLTNSTFKTSPAKYVIGAAHADSGTEHYLYSCEKTDKNNSWGYVTADLASNTPIEFTLSGTAAALVATSTEVSARYLKPMAEKDFQLSASSQTVELKADGTIYNNNTGDTSWRLLYNKAGGLRWYSSNVSGSTNAYFYEVVAGGEVNYRTSCCADKVAAPSVTATKTSTTVTLTWAAVSGATGYELQWNGGAWTAATSGVVKSDLTPNTNYSWRVRATYDPLVKCGADIASGSTTTNQVYHVTYAKGSGTGSCNATGSTTDGTAYEAGATVTLQSNGFTLVGHTFNEWTEDDEDITISSNQFTMPEHDVVITATWTPKVDKFYDRMHDGTDASHGGIADGDGKYYITREGCSYTVPSLTDNTSGATACHTKHYVLMGWTAESHLNSDGTLKTGHEGYVYTGGGTQTATGATYYAVWAEVEE